MSSDLKPGVQKEDTFDLLDIRIGKVVAVEDAPEAVKKSYSLQVDFGKYGVKTTVARLTCHAPEDLLGLLVFGVLNMGERVVGGIKSEFLCLGVQVSKLNSGEATPVTPLNPNVKLGSKLF